LDALVADLGNSRLKWGRLDAAGVLSATVALPVDEPAAWAQAWDRWSLSGEMSRWAIASVNPRAADRLRSFLEARSVTDLRWWRSAADVPLPHALEEPEKAGADRALAVLAALRLEGTVGPGLVISCGSAIVVEQISAEGEWQGGAIAPGLGLSARALHLLTAQLPEVDAVEAPPPWGRSTEPALGAGLFWGAVGAIKEIVARQSAVNHWEIWTGGDASRLAPYVSGQRARVVPDLVLLGLAHVAFGATEVARS
jgi:type III pantothenate kinase